MYSSFALGILYPSFGGEHTLFSAVAGLEATSASLFFVALSSSLAAFSTVHLRPNFASYLRRASAATSTCPSSSAILACRTRAPPFRVEEDRLSSSRCPAGVLSRLMRWLALLRALYSSDVSPSRRRGLNILSYAELIFASPSNWIPVVLTLDLSRSERNPFVALDVGTGFPTSLRPFNCQGEPKNVLNCSYFLLSGFSETGLTLFLSFRPP